MDAAFDGCCIDGECKVTSDTIPVSCYCDSLCYTFGDCCDDIALTNCHPNTSKSPYSVDEISLKYEIRFAFPLPIQEWWFERTL